MKRNETQSDAVRTPSHRKKAGAWNQVFNRKGERIRGLWERNDNFYAQLSVGGRIMRLRIDDAATVADATTGLQVLKKQAKDGTLKPPQEAESDGDTHDQDKKRTISDAIEEYQRHTKLLENKDEQTLQREESSFKAWRRKFGSTDLDKVDDALLKAFAEWRKTEDGGEVEGRTIDLDVRALRHALTRAVEIKWIQKMPIGRWKPLAKQPEETRLITPEELDRLCEEALPTPLELKFISEELCGSGQAFADYMRLLAYSGGREQETIQLKWSNVHWDRKVLHFVKCKRGAGSQESGQPRDVDFHAKLQSHLTDMYGRRKVASEWIFPSHRVTGPMRDFAKQLRKVKKKTGTTNLGFHHFRHYFISMAVMAGVDFATIAKWVGHRDGGVLIGKVYGHLSREHPSRMARKLDKAF